MKLNRRQFLAGLLSVGAVIALPVAQAFAAERKLAPSFRSRSGGMR